MTRKNTKKRIQIALRRINLSILENHHSGCRLFFFYIFYQTKQPITQCTSRATRSGADHSASPSLRIKNLFDLCTPALFTGTSNVFVGFLASFCTMVLGLESSAFTSLVLSRNNSRPCSMHNIKLIILYPRTEIAWKEGKHLREGSLPSPASFQFEPGPRA